MTNQYRMGLWAQKQLIKATGILFQNKDLAKEMLNKSGVFSKISKPAPMKKIQRNGTQFLPCKP